MSSKSFIAIGEEITFQKLDNNSLENFEIGFVIGQKHEEKFYIIHLSPISFHSPFSNNDEENLPNINCISDIGETTIITQASQVVRMLPGGLDILGFYLNIPLSDLNHTKNLTKLRILLTTLHKTTSKYYLGADLSSLEKLILYRCSQSSKNGIKSIDLSEQGSVFIPGTLKIQTTKWIEINYNYSLSHQIYLKKEKSTQPICRSVLASFEPWTKSIQDCVIIFDGKLYDNDELLDPEMEEKVKKKGNRALIDMKPPKVMTAMFLEKCKLVSKVAEIQESSSSVIFNGTIAGRAFVHSKATAEEGQDGVRKDLIRSLVSRWEMHCDSLVEEPLGTSLESVLHEPPRRVFLEGGGLPVSLCDYLFPGDSLSDACQSAEELLNIVVNPDNVDDSLEIWTDSPELLYNIPDSPSIATSTDKELTYSGRSYVIYIIMAIVVALFAVGISYIFITKNKLKL